MGSLSYEFYQALVEYVLHERRGETHTYLGQPMCNARPHADMHLDNKDTNNEND